MRSNINLISQIKATLLKPALGAAAMGALAISAPAAPIQRADVAADPAWVAHLDCDALRRTEIGKHLLEELNKPEAQNKLAAFQAMFNFDPRTQLHGVTFYSSGNPPVDGVLLAYGDFDRDRLITFAKAAQDAQNTKHNQHVIYNWVDEKKHAKNGVKPRIYAAIDGQRIVFAQREARVAGALDVLDGLAPNLSTSNLIPKTGAADEAAFLQAAARKLDIGEENPKAAILKLSKLVRLQVGEAQQQARATLSLEADNEEVATHIAEVAQGLVALMKLQQEKPEATKLAQALTIKQEGAKVVASLSMPASDVIDLMKADAARKAKHHKAEAKNEN